jgi:propanediol dehydratase small subunit
VVRTIYGRHIGVVVGSEGHDVTAVSSVWLTEIRALSGKPVDGLTVERCGREVGVADLRIHPETLERRRSWPNSTATRNWPRTCAGGRADPAADDEVLAIYEALRPGRSTPGQLTELAASLEARGLPRCAALLTEAADVYAAGACPRRGGRRVTVIAGSTSGTPRRGRLVSGGKILGAGRVPARGRKARRARCAPPPRWSGGWNASSAARSARRGSRRCGRWTPRW